MPVVASHNDLDNVPVVRVALCLKAESSIDYHLKKQIGLGFVLKELIADLTLDFRSSLSLTGECASVRCTRPRPLRTRALLEIAQSCWSQGK